MLRCVAKIKRGEAGCRSSPPEHPLFRSGVLLVKRAYNPMNYSSKYTAKKMQKIMFQWTRWELFSVRICSFLLFSEEELTRTQDHSQLYDTNAKRILYH